MPDDKPDEKEPIDARGSTAPQPFKVVKRAEETGGAFVRIEAVLYPSIDDPSIGDPSIDAPQKGSSQSGSRSTSQTGSSLKHPRWMVDTSGEHLHPRQEEYFKVLSGQLRVALRGDEQTLREGEEITLPPRVPHRHWNPADRPARIALEHRPALQSELIFETLYESAKAGYADEEGFPNFLQLAVLQNKCPDHAYTTDLPIIVQKGLFAVLGPLGRLLGYRVSSSQAAPSQPTPSQPAPSEDSPPQATSPPTEPGPSRRS